MKIIYEMIKRSMSWQIWSKKNKKKKKKSYHKNKVPWITKSQSVEENALRATESVPCKETNTHLRGDRNSFTEKGMSEKQTEFQQVEKERRNIMSQDRDGGAARVHWRVSHVS